jgi:hypothetical protein
MAEFLVQLDDVGVIMWKIALSHQVLVATSINLQADGWFKIVLVCRLLKKWPQHYTLHGARSKFLCYACCTSF